MNILSLLSPKAQARIQSMSDQPGGPFKTSDKFAAAAQEIAGDPAEVGLTRDHIMLVAALVAIESGVEPQTLIVMAAAIDQLREAGQVSA